MPDFLSSQSETLGAIEEHLDLATQNAQGCPSRLSDAIRYSVLAPGKRLRPLMCLLACKAVGGNWRDALPAAVAVELIHVYSLIHDDLPAMDNDDMRRGKPTCHREFDEATAILAGDSLQMLAIESLCKLPVEKVPMTCKVLSIAAGRQHLVGGQQDDLAAEGRFGKVDFGDTSNAKLEFLKSIHRRKTGALIDASLRIGGIVGGASQEHIEVLGDFGQAIGLAFQIVDDCLDVEATSEQLGKQTRKDSILGKLTYPSLLGLQPSKDLAAQLLGDAKRSLAVFNESSHNLGMLADFIVERKT